MIDTKLEEDLGLEYDLVETVMSSLRTNQVDYCFNTKSFNAILRLSKEYDLYRQDYCGCEFSLKEHEEKIKDHKCLK